MILYSVHKVASKLFRKKSVFLIFGSPPLQFTHHYGKHIDNICILCLIISLKYSAPDWRCNFIVGDNDDKAFFLNF